MIELLGSRPSAIYSNLLLKAEAFQKLRKKKRKGKLLLEYKKNMMNLWGGLIQRFSKKHPVRILHPEIGRQLKYLIETNTPSALQIDSIVERLERLTGGDEYFIRLSDVQIARAWHAESIRYADENGIITCQGVGPVDEKTCPVCMRPIGIDIDVGKMLEKIAADLNIEDPDEYVQAWHFRALRMLGA